MSNNALRALVLGGFAGLLVFACGDESEDDASGTGGKGGSATGGTVTGGSSGTGGDKGGSGGTSGSAGRGGSGGRSGSGGAGEGGSDDGGTGNIGGEGGMTDGGEGGESATGGTGMGGHPMGGMAGNTTAGMGGAAGSAAAGMSGMAGNTTAGMGGMGGGGAGGAGGAGGSAGETLVNGCSLATATDATGMSQVTVTFPALAYSPKCLKVTVNTSVVFDGSFVGHPLLGGEVVGGALSPASSGPFVPVTDTGLTKTFTMTSVGTYPYYCTTHGAVFGMAGVVYVVP
jgi:plastocyanin